MFESERSIDNVLLEAMVTLECLELDVDRMREALIGKWRFVRTGLDFEIHAVFRSPRTHRIVCTILTGTHRSLFVSPANTLEIAAKLGCIARA